jgi:hypothetical protein
MRNTNKIFVGIPERKRPFGRHRRRWEDNVKIDIIEIGWEVIDRVHLAEDRDR